MKLLVQVIVWLVFVPAAVELVWTHYIWQGVLLGIFTLTLYHATKFI